jgi:acetoin utilization deacetylase AcuC-like enzyme
LSPDERILLVVSRGHAIHRVRKKGYFERPFRIEAILGELEPTGLFLEVPARHFADRHVLAVHDRAFVACLKKTCEHAQPGQLIFPYVFPVRNAARLPADLAVRSGYYCLDTFTPLHRDAYRAARHAVDCALTAADAVLRGRGLAYGLIRPPGHHVERRFFGGFCYLNSTAVAANYLSRAGKVAVLDLDFHHGNGQQDIFYQRRDVLTVSIHCHPRFEYPHFAGFEDERGAGPGKGYNVNIPLPQRADGRRYRRALRAALKRVTEFGPRFLVVALGLDTATRDPSGSWNLRAADFEANGKMVGALRLPTLLVQEGGYRRRRLGIAARHFFGGLWAAWCGPEAGRRP